MLCLGKPHHRWDALSMQGNEHFSAASWYSPLFRTKISNFCSYTLLKSCWSWKFGTCNVAVGDCSAGKGICAHMLTEILMQCMAPVYPWGCRPQWACCILVLSANELPSIASSLPLTHLASLSPFLLQPGFFQLFWPPVPLAALSFCHVSVVPWCHQMCLILCCTCANSQVDMACCLITPTSPECHTWFSLLPDASKCSGAKLAPFPL